MPDELVVAEGGALNDVQKEFINKNFRGAMSEEHGTHASMADYKDLDGLGKSYINQQKLIGNPNTVAVPNNKSTPEEWTTFNRKVGLPMESKDYGLTTPEGGADTDREWFEKHAFEELQLSKVQAKKLWNSLNERNKSKTEEFTTANQNKLDEGMKSLKEEYGANFDGMVKFTNKGLQRFDGDGRFRKFMKETGLNKHPEMLRFANKVATQFNEDRVPSDTRTPTPQSREQAQAQLNKIYSDSAKEGIKSTLMNRKDPAHDDLIKKVTRLSVIAGGGK